MMYSSFDFIKTIPLKVQLFGWSIGILFYATYTELVVGEDFGSIGDFVLSTLFMLFVVYLNVLFLIPRAIRNRKRKYFCLFLFVLLEVLVSMSLIIFTSIAVGALEVSFRGMVNWIFISNFFILLIPLISSLGLSACFYGLILGIRQNNELNAVKDSNRALMNELEICRQNLLKAQLDPHFLNSTFVMLRYLIRESPLEANEALNIMHDILLYYQQYTETGLISLSDELEQVHKLIAINEIYLQKNPCFRLAVAGDIKGLQTIPMMVLLLVENIFKYAVLDDEHHPALVKVDYTNNKLSVYTENKINDLSDVVSTGTGLQNLRERLNHFYSALHDFEVIEDDKFFKVKLRILMLEKI